MKLPILRLLRQMDVGPIVVYGPAKVVSLVQDHELADHVVPETKKLGMFEMSAMLRQYAPARCIHFHRSMRAPAAAWLANVPERIGVSDGGAFIFNTHHAPFWSATGHFVLRYGAALAKRWPCLPAVPFADYRPTVKVDSPQNGYICLMPGSSWSPKSWPVDCFRELAAKARLAALDVAVLGSAQDRCLGDAILEGLGDHGHNLCGLTDLPNAAAWLAGAMAAIGNDSGLSHLAAACGTKTISIFGPTNPGATAPWGPNATALGPQGLSCCPCLKKGLPRTDKALRALPCKPCVQRDTLECLTRTTPEQVWQQVVGSE